MRRSRRSRRAWQTWDWRPAGLLLLFAVVVLLAAAVTGFSLWFWPDHPG